MELSISERNKRWLEQQMKSGKYESADALLDDARQLLEERDRELAEELADIHEKVRIGLAQADAGELIPAEEVFERLLRRNAERRK